MNFLKGYELWFLLIPILIFGLLIYFYGFDLRGSYEGEVVIDGRAFNVDVAETPADKQQGLSGRESLGEDEGLLFVFSKPRMQRFWMKDMLMSIDIIWIHDNAVVGFEQDVRPEPGVPTRKLKVYSSPEPVEYVLEVRAGTVRDMGIAVGDEATIRL